MEEELQKQELLATTAGQLDTKPVDTFAPEIPIQAEDVFVSQDVLDDAALQAELLGEELYKDSRSLLERFRKKGSLSVTDFCSPSVRLSLCRSHKAHLVISSARPSSVTLYSVEGISRLRKDPRTLLVPTV